MKNIILFLIFIFPFTNQLTCLVNCRIFKVPKGKSFQDPSPSDQNICKYDRRAIRCYGQIMVYYNQNNGPELISYSLGSQNHIIEKEIEELANKNRFKSIIYFLFLIESFDTNELVITAYIICQTNDNCALNYIKDFFHLYYQQTNPVNEFNSLYTNNNIISKLTCYDYETKKTKECLINQYATCIIHDIDMFQQGCYSDPNTKLEYAFMITSSEKTSLKKVYELIVCNTHNCNENSIIKTIENMIYNYTFGTIILLNNSNQIKFHLFIFQIFFTIYLI